MSILVIAEHDQKELAPPTLNTVTAAAALGGDIHILVAGSGSDSVAQAAVKLAGVAKVLHADDPAYAHPLAENIAALIANNADGYSHVLAPASFFGKNVLPRAAALKDAQQISDITAIEGADTFVRPIYAGNAMETVKSNQDVHFITVRPTAFDAVNTEGGNASIEKIESAGDSASSKFVKEELTESERPELGTAKVIVSGGRGVGSGENFKIIDALADKLGAAVGASRAAVDAGYVPNDYQVGQTGKVVAPDLYIAV